MSAPKAKRTIYDDTVDAELARWGDVTYNREVRGKHYALVLVFDGRSRFVVYPTSPGDAVRGVQNHLTDVRAELRALGAQRVAEKKSISPRRQRNRTEAARLELGEPLIRDPTRDPFAGLVAYRKALTDQAPMVLPIKTGRRGRWLPTFLKAFR